MSVISLLNQTSSNEEMVNWGNTTVNVDKFKYIWTISNFSLCDEKTGEFLISPSFSSGMNDNQNWSLKLFTKGEDENSKDYISLYLYLAPYKDSSVVVTYKLSILNSSGEKTNECSEVRTFSNEYMLYGNSQFIKRDILFDKAYDLLIEDTLIINCELGIESSEDKSGCLYSIPFKVPKCHLPDDLADLFEIEKFSDVTLLVNGRELKAHKNILSVRSPVFAAMFEHETEEFIQNSITITEIDYEVLREMLRFIYTGQTTKLECMAENLLVAADKYGLERLKVLCEEAICNNMSVNNVAKILVLADLHSADQLKLETVEFIKIHYKIVKNTTGWKNLVQSHSHLLEAELDALLIIDTTG